MSKEKIVEALKSVKGENLPKIDPEILELLVTLKEKALMLSMEAQEADLAFRRHVAGACKQKGAPIDRSIVCLGCGSIRPVQTERCPNCVG
jgi:hypothetical protein